MEYADSIWYIFWGGISIHDKSKAHMIRIHHHIVYKHVQFIIIHITNMCYMTNEVQKAVLMY